MLEIKDKKDRALWALFSTLVLYLIAHGYRFTDTMLSGDSLLMVYQNDYAWQIALGRCFQPIWLFFRGSITSPWLILMSTLFWLVLSVYLTSVVLDIRNKAVLVLLAGVMTINTALICSNATYLPWVDMYAFALFLATAGVWCLERGKYRYCIPGILAIALSLGTYQAYVSVAVTLMVLVFYRDFYQGRPFAGEWKKLVKYIISFLLAGLLYFACWKICQKAFHIWTSDSYNGLASVGDYTDVSIAGLIKMTYQKVLYFFWHPDVFVSLYFQERSLSIVWLWLLCAANLFCVIFIAAATVFLNCRRKTKLWHRLLQACILLVFPVCVNVVCLISKGMVHTLMIYSYVYVYVLALVLAGECLKNVPPGIERNYVVSVLAEAGAEKEMAAKVQESVTENPVAGKVQESAPEEFRDGKNSANGKSLRRLTELAVSLLALSIAAVCWVNVVYANQIYLKRQLQEKAAAALMNRIAGDVEDMEGYEAGVTKVTLVGSFEQSAAVTDINGFQDLVPYGMGKTSMTYAGTETAMLNFLLQENMNLVDRRDIQADEQAVRERLENDIQDMPFYPADGSIRQLGDTIVVKISNLY